MEYKGSVFSVRGCDVKVKCSRIVKHKKYLKRLVQFFFVKAHSEISLVNNQMVTIKLCKPISKTKKFIVINAEVLK